MPNKREHDISGLEQVVLRQTGQSYERAALEKHLSRHSTCPSTGIILHRDKSFVSNHQLRKSIQEFQETQRRMTKIQPALKISLIALLHCSARYCSQLYSIKRTIFSLNTSNIGRHRELGSWEEAIARCNEALSISELIFGRDDPSRTAVVLGYCFEFCV